MTLGREIRKTSLFLAGLIFLLGNVSITSAFDYEIIQISNNDATSRYYQDTHPAINNNGQINWVSWESNFMYGEGVRMFFDGANTIELPSPSGETASYYQPENSMNDGGDLVWSAHTGNGLNILLYDGNNIIQLTDNAEGNLHSVINENGQVVWHTSSKGIYFYDGTSTIKLSTASGMYYRPDLNDLGQVVWASNNGINFYDGTQIQIISPSGANPRINNNGHIVWGLDQNIYHYDGLDINILGSGYSPRINDKNDVAWMDFFNLTLYLYDGTSTQIIADNLMFSYPDISNAFDINNKGQLCWIEKQNLGNASYEYKLYFYDGTNISNVSTFGPKWIYPQFNSIDMNDRGDIVWRYNDDGDDEIYLAQAASNNPPLAEAGAVQEVVECSGPSGSLVTLDGSGSSDPDGDTLTYTWSGIFGTRTGVTANVVLPLGTHTITLTVDDGNGGIASDTVIIDVEDTTVPVTSIDNIIGTEGENDWYISDVDLGLSASDTCSGVKRIYYTVNAAETIVMGATASFSITEDDIYTVTYWAEDNAGNVETSNIITLKIDETPPEITIEGIEDGQEYALGLVPTASYSVTDNLSGVLTSNAELSGGDANGLGAFTYSVSAEDNAGNPSSDPSDVATYTVIATIEGTRVLIDQYVVDLAIRDDLNDELDDAQAFIDNGSYDQAIQTLEQFKQDVDKAKDKDKILTEVAAVLTAAANYMIQNLQGMN